MSNYIKLQDGDGGKHTAKLIREVFNKNFNNPILACEQDAAVLNFKNDRVAFSTDSFVVKPLFFKGGDIGKLAVCGTINDLCATGAKPLFLTAAFIIEEGFERKQLEKIAHSMGEICRETKTMIVAGDTKVVEKGFADGLFINTSGIGIINSLYNPRKINPHDEIIITGEIGEHGTVILVDRYKLGIEGNFASDCCPLSFLLETLKDNLQYIKLMRDPTRGGLATALCEIAVKQKLGILLEEEKLPISKHVQAVNELLGTDYLYLACEGRMIIVVENGFGEKVLENIRKNNNCQNAQIIGSFREDVSCIVQMVTKIGGKRIINMLENQMIPRIC